MFLRSAIVPGLAGVLLLMPVKAHCNPGPLNPTVQEERCNRGDGGACYSLGTQAEKQGNDEQAFGWYQTACLRRAPTGSLFPCDHYFRLALKLDRLDEARAGLKNLCEKEGGLRCYHQGRALLEIGRREEGQAVLTRLCRDDFRLPFSAAFGPCKDLAESLASNGDQVAALQYYELDCKRNHKFSHLSCSAREALQAKMNRSPKTRREPVFWALYGLLAMPLFSLGLLFIGLRTSLQGARLVIPAVTFAGWWIWESRVLGVYDIRVDLFLILPAVALVLVCAVIAHFRLKKSCKSTPG